MSNASGYKRFYKLYKSASELDVVTMHQLNARKLLLLSIVNTGVAIQYYKGIPKINSRFRKTIFWGLYYFTNTFKSAEKREIAAIKKKSPLHRITTSMRTRLSSYCRKIQIDKNFKTMDALGCTSSELKHHLQSKFTEGMNWDNYGKWHVDHIKPISFAKTEQEAIQLSHYTNLQPLWAADNLKKSNKYE